ncbi:hypothetical protein GJ654_10280 [Rhodoblastus acidophilus]|uniref:Uncharacterized protein n=1 Tax=Rhodoblastus acidophilus TaxID=1074 RepID=A0A6N8DLH9_RHOAC|nr:hypothetical protein [Rhodoblastus acidophilus]MCW2275111.1 hypothetical protein [Rhodoblastus acidophilus]MTV31380.1 hypothetical protein [Rhodoblastus acidophilus]
MSDFHNTMEELRALLGTQEVTELMQDIRENGVVRDFAKRLDRLLLPIQTCRDDGAIIGALMELADHAASAAASMDAKYRMEGSLRPALLQRIGDVFDKAHVGFAGLVERSERAA